MKNLALHPEYQLYERSGKALCSSRQMAKTFKKDHRHVLQSIKNAIEMIKKVDAEFSAANFFESNYKDRGKFYPEYLLAKDGFSYGELLNV